MHATPQCHTPSCPEGCFGLRGRMLCSYCNRVLFFFFYEKLKLYYYQNKRGQSFKKKGRDACNLGTEKLTVVKVVVMMVEAKPNRVVVSTGITVVAM